MAETAVARASKIRAAEADEPGRVGEHILFWRMLGSKLEAVPGQLIRHAPTYPAGTWDINIHLHGNVKALHQKAFSDHPTATCWTKLEA